MKKSKEWNLFPCKHMIWPCKVYSRTYGIDKKWHTITGYFDGVGMKVRSTLQTFMDNHPERQHFRGCDVKVINMLGTVTLFVVNPDNGQVEFY